MVAIQGVSLLADEVFGASVSRRLKTLHSTGAKVAVRKFVFKPVRLPSLSAQSNEFSQTDL